MVYFRDHGFSEVGLNGGSEFSSIECRGTYINVMAAVFSRYTYCSVARSGHNHQTSRGIHLHGLQVLTFEPREISGEDPGKESPLEAGQLFISVASI